MAALVTLKNKIVKLLPAVVAAKLPKEIGITEVSEVAATRLNLQYRKKRTAPNVLSFCYGEDYGEIILCPAVIRREARDAQQPYEFRMTWMVVHGMLHLAGWHHEQSQRMAGRVERMEQRILKDLFPLSGSLRRT